MKKVVFGGILAALIICAVSLPLIPVLSISNRKNPSESIYSIQALEDGFAVAYTHSVNKGRVRDYYEITADGTLLMDRTEFVSYGAGIPEASETEGAQFRVTGDGYTIEHLNRSMKQLVLGVGVVAEHAILLGGDEFFLKDFFKPMTTLIFEVRRISVLNLLITKRLED